MACLRWEIGGRWPGCRLACVVLLLLALADVVLTRRRVSKTMKCEQMQIPLCSKIGYNMTYMPNRFNQKTQIEAALEVNKFWPLVSISCAPDLKFFLCASYAPICEPHYGRELYPCRSICERVQRGCLPVMKKHGFTWPEALDCSKYPKKGDTLCMEHNSGPDNTSTTPPPTRSIAAAVVEHTRGSRRTVAAPSWPTNQPPHVATVSNFEEVKKVLRKFKGSHGVLCGCQCQDPFTYINASVVDGPRNFPACVLPCRSFYFSVQQRNFMSVWVTVLAILCFLSSLFAFMTYLIDRSRFTYPERPMAFIALSYVMISLGFIVRLLFGFDSVACNPSTGLLRYSATGPTPCMAVFLLIYFFTMSSWLWWVILSLSWFLAAGMKWSEEAIAGYSRYFHGIAWTIPTLKTMAALAMTGVDGDPVSGICFIGNNDLSMLTIFLIAPLLVYVMLGSSFLTAGLLALFHIRRIIKRNGSDTHKLEQLMIKVGVYSALYIFPSSVVIACYFYEHSSRDGWEKSKNCPCVRNESAPSFHAYLLKYSMMLAVGISSGFWMLGSKTWNSWSVFFQKRCCGKHRSNLHRREKQALAPVAL